MSDNAGLETADGSNYRDGAEGVESADGSNYRVADDPGTEIADDSNYRYEPGQSPNRIPRERGSARKDRPGHRDPYAVDAGSSF